MDKGYLLILIGAIVSATIVFPFPLPAGVLELWYRVALWGYALIAMGIRYMHTSRKELNNALNFTYAALITALALSWLPRLITFNMHVIFFMMILQMFFSLGIFFWLFKAEYMWAPHMNKRIDWMLYSGIALIHLIVVLIPAVANAFGTQSFNLATTWFFIITSVYFSVQMPAPTTMAQAFVFINLLYNVILIYILVKLYLDARRNSSGLKRWN